MSSLKVELSAAQHVERIRGSAAQLAEQLRDATDAGVSHALILPQLVLVFRETFGVDMTLPDLSQLGGGS